MVKKMATSRGFRPTRLSALRSHVYVVAVMISVSFLSTGCWYFHCLDAQCASPHQLLDENDVVFIGKLSQVRTVEQLGSAEYFGELDDVLLIEYAFKPTEMIMGSANTPTYYLWFLETISKVSGYDSGIQATPNTTELIYGNIFRSHDDLLHLIFPLTMRRKREVVMLLEGQLQEFETIESRIGDPVFDSTIAVRLMKSEKVRRALAERTDDVVLYATDPYYLTNYFFRQGHLQYCDESRQEGDYVSSDKYIEQLKAAAQED